jgi:hypothetical protein
MSCDEQDKTNPAITIKINMVKMVRFCWDSIRSNLDIGEPFFVQEILYYLEYSITNLWYRIWHFDSQTHYLDLPVLVFLGPSCIMGARYSKIIDVRGD